MMRLNLKYMIGLAIFSILVSSSAREEILNLAVNGQTEYVIVLPDNPSVLEKETVNDLRDILRQVTAADFDIKTAAEAASFSKRIFVGRPGEKLRDFERVILSSGNDIYLYGAGDTGNIFAVYDFLDRIIGCRWYTPYGDKRIPRHENLQIKPFRHSIIPSFYFRDTYHPQWDNLGVGTAADFFRRQRMTQHGELLAPRQLGPFIHTFNKYVPAYVSPGNLPVLKDKAYFKEHPEYFSLRGGKRVDNHQLCLSNPDLRKTFMENLELTVAAEYTGGYAVIEVDQNDISGELCECAPCRDLSAKYQSQAGPLYDFLLELAPVFQEKYPKIMIRFLAHYGPSETLPHNVKKLPDNLLPFFAPIAGDFSKPWTSVTNRGIYRALRQWSGISNSMSLWYYSNTYCRPGLAYPLTGNINRLVRDLRSAAKFDMKVLFIEHCANENLGFMPLQTYLIVQLSNDIGLDEQELIKDFFDSYYGAAAGKMHEYFKELEELLAKEKCYLRWNPDERILSYVNPANLLRWQKLFDEMEQLTAGQENELYHVRTTRINLDLNTLAIWPGIRRELPDADKELDTVFERYTQNMNVLFDKSIGKPGPRERRKERFFHCARSLYLLGKGIPLPDGFDAPGVVAKQAIPYINKSFARPEPSSPFGYAARSNPDKELRFVLHDYTLNKNVAIVDIPSEKVMQTEGYHLYKLATVKLSNDCHFSLPSSGEPPGLVGFVALGHLFDENDREAEWDVYASMRYDKENHKILMDHFLLRKK